MGWGCQARTHVSAHSLPGVLVRSGATISDDVIHVHKDKDKLDFFLESLFLKKKAKQKKKQKQQNIYWLKIGMFDN